MFSRVLLKSRTPARLVLSSNPAWTLASRSTAIKPSIRRFVSSAVSMAGKPQHTNRLANESSPYLLQHQHNPVDWYPWGPDAFEKARKEDKPIFLSVGYSTCRWCHVMERECFENEQVARVMNDVCVNVKVDREVLPDIDRIYMMFVQATTGRGGWPMSVFLTPDLKPFFAGTYFPPGALLSILEQIDEKWKDSRESVIASASKLHALLSSHISPPTSISGLQSIKPSVDQAMDAFHRRFDRVHGGFGGAPKFPTAPIFTLLHTKASLGAQEGLDMAGFTLTKIDRGGIHDHVGSGFHRYSVDGRWHIPHFEKMLYDQAQLALAFLRQYTLTSDPAYLSTVLDILAYTARDLYSPEHKAFYAAEDAESLPTESSTKKEEGAYWVWTRTEVDEIVGAGVGSDVLSAHYTIRTEGNVDPAHDPHGELRGKNVLMRAGSLGDTHAALVEKYPELTVGEVERLAREGREKLFEVRVRTRPRPHRDEKMVAAWNGMMGRALAWVSRILGETEGQGGQDWYERAEELIGFLDGNMMLEDGRLRRIYGSDVEGVVDDYAHIVSFLLALYQVRFDPKYLQMALRLQAKQDELFWDGEAGGYFTSSTIGMREGSKIMRLKDDQDGAEPSANSTSLNNLITLDAIAHATSSQLLGLSESSFDFTDHYDQNASKLLAYFSGTLEEHPTAVPDLLSSGFLREVGIKSVIFSGGSDQEEVEEFVRRVRGGRWEPDVVYVSEVGVTGEKVSGRVCFGGTCGLKKEKADEVREEIESLRKQV